MKERIEYSHAECSVLYFDGVDVIATSVPTGSSGGNMDDAWDR